MEPGCSYDYRNMEVEIPNSRVKTEPLEWGPTVKTEYQEEPESSSENNQPRSRLPSLSSSESDSDDDMVNYSPGDRIIRARGTWKTLCSDHEDEPSDDIPLSRLISHDQQNLPSSRQQNLSVKVERSENSPSLRSTAVGTDTPPTEENQIEIPSRPSVPETAAGSNDDSTVENTESSENKYSCRLCDKKFNSRYTLYIHLNKGHKDKIQCVNCKCRYKTWRELEDHEPYCTRRYGLIRIPPRAKRPEKKPKTPYKCCLCHRRYEKYSHLFDHQVKRCKKRYVRAQWVVKI